MGLDIEALRKICKPENIEITMHAAKRLEQRGIKLGDIINCVIYGDIIEQYPTDYPYPSCLILGTAVNNKFLHTVVGSDLVQLWIVTAYYPDTAKWSDNFRVRRES